MNRFALFLFADSLSRWNTWWFRHHLWLAHRVTRSPAGSGITSDWLIGWPGPLLIRLWCDTPVLLLLKLNWRGVHRGAGSPAAPQWTRTVEGRRGPHWLVCLDSSSKGLPMSSLSSPDLGLHLTGHSGYKRHDNGHIVSYNLANMIFYNCRWEVV